MPLPKLRPREPRPRAASRAYAFRLGAAHMVSVHGDGGQPRLRHHRRRRRCCHHGFLGRERLRVRYQYRCHGFRPEP